MLTVVRQTECRAWWHPLIAIQRERYRSLSHRSLSGPGDGLVKHESSPERMKSLYAAVPLDGAPGWPADDPGI
jgi:hypothetical protein